MNPHELTYELLEEMGVKDPDPALAEQFETHFAKVIMETLLRRVPEERLPEIRQALDREDADVEAVVAEIASEIPGLAEEIEEAVGREYDALKNWVRP